MIKVTTSIEEGISFLLFSAHPRFGFGILLWLEQSVDEVQQKYSKGWIAY